MEDLVKNLEKEISIKYKTTLSEMSHIFGGYFRLIFGGGKASLNEAKLAVVLAEESEEEEASGVEIKLDLPNKKVKT